MKVHYVRAMIERDPMTVIPVCVLATAIPILQMVHGGKITDVHIQDQCDDLNPDDEYDRLSRVYGERPNTGKSYAEEIFGSAHGLQKRMFIRESANDAPDAVDDDEPDNGDEDDDIFGSEEPVVPKKHKSRGG